MEFTGERYVPSVGGQIKYEHLHRYAIALEFAASRTVLDLASGEGYGAAILSSAAEFVVGVDADPNSVAQATTLYERPNLSFAVGACEATPLADASFDVITSFETIEHHNKHDEMLSEIKRVLKPGGVLVMSSPNKLTYSDLPGYRNPFHVKELYYEEFLALLKHYFKNVQLYGQRLASGSFIHPLAEGTGDSWRAWNGDADRLVPKVCPLTSPLYFIAICSDAAGIEKRELSSVYINRSDDLFEPGHDPWGDEPNAEFNNEGLAADGLLSDLMRARARALRASVAAEANHAHIVRQSAGVAKARARYAKQLQEQEERISRLSELVERTTVRYHAEVARTENERLCYSDARQQLSRQAEAIDWTLRSKNWRIAATLYRLTDWRRSIGRLFRRKVFRGELDRPQTGDLASDVLEVEGWVYSKAAPVTLLQVFLDDMFFGNIRYDKERRNVDGALRQEVPLSCGYHERISLHGLSLSGKRSLKIMAYDAKGNTCCYTREVSLLPSPLIERDDSRADILIGALNHPKPGETTPDLITIAGWVYSRMGPITLVEARIGQFSLGKLTYGLRRPDVPMLFPGAPLECGFCENLSLSGLAHGEQELMIRVVDAKGHIRTFTRIITIGPHVANAVRGMLDFPRQGALEPGFIEIMGWVYSTVGSIAGVEAWIGDLYLGSLRYGVPRLDVVAGFPEAPAACGFEERISLRGLTLHGQKTLRIKAYDEHGNEAVYTQSIVFARSKSNSFRLKTVDALSEKRRSAAQSG